MSNSIYINQLGYLPGSRKQFLTTSKADYFKVVSIEKGTVFEGEVKLRKKNDKSTGETVYVGDFSELYIEGSFYIELSNNEKSYQFLISKDIYNRVLKNVVKSYYFQRCGTSLTEELAGEFARPACHYSDTEFHPTTGIFGKKNVTGGWHDAGDYGRYITPGATALSAMLLGYELYPEKYESVSGLFYNEVMYEFNWMFKMQELNIDNQMCGAVHYMVNSPNYGWAEPHKDSEKQYIMGYCSIATADFAAIMACASRLFSDSNAEFSKKALERAKLAWSFIENNPPYPLDGFVRPEGMNTGGYAETRSNNIFTDLNKLWPAVELFLTTGEEKYHSIAKELFRNRKSSYGSMSWVDKTGFAEMKYVSSKNSNIDVNLKKALRKRLLKRCNRYLKNRSKSAFNVLLNEKEYNWGSNSEVFNRAVQLLFGYTVTQNEDLKDAALDQLNYILGLNIIGISFISGLGTYYTKNIHHASFDNDGINYNFPGMMPGGPNKSVETSAELFDKALYKACPPGTPGAKCYVDDVESFSSNENCITYSAPLISVAAFFSH